ncbi:hypothetical protein G3I01_12660 [Gramella sp. MT6]|uniref:M56 family metallopeptidase n=1 Tax=Gramella sp. MT6 TaxID=2705471 RepID=UPI001C604BF6|nr:M56 family metallopeptidase [Gramella sp. MT6]QYA26320.1 hypothetical protein G3I01_12660 [Gramella sp. MT6]
MLIYLLKSGLCLLVLFSFYKFFLENENFHKVKRIYLLAALFLSFSLPLITFTYEVEVPAPSTGGEFEEVNFTDRNSKDSWINWQILLYGAAGIYLAGLFFFGYRFYKNLRSLLKEANSNERLTELNYIYILLGQKLDPYSFFNYIFLNKTEFKNDKISEAVIEHEKAHVDQRHSLDLVFIEILQIIFWFNPIFFWIKRSIKLNHEFLADKEVLSKDFNALEYSNILFNYSSGYHHNTLSSPINHSLIKKRIIMITKDFSIKKLLLRAGLFVPVLGCCIFFFNNEIIAKPVYISEKSPANLKTSELPFLESNTEYQPVDIANKQSVYQQPDLRIKVENEKVWINGKATKPGNFAEEIDAVTSKLKDEELMDVSINLKTSNAVDGFMEELDREFKKTRLAKVTGRNILPPPPPLPPSPAEIGQVPPPPPPPPHPEHNGLLEDKLDHEERMKIPHREHSANFKEDRERLAKERAALRSKEAELRKLERQLNNDQKLSETEKQRILRDQARERARVEEIELRMEQKQKELEERQEEMERRQIEAEKRHQNKSEAHSSRNNGDSNVLTEDVNNENGFVVKTTASKEKSITKYPKDAVYFLNDNEISYQKAMKIIKEGKAKQIDIRKISENKDAVKIYI